MKSKEETIIEFLRSHPFIAMNRIEEHLNMPARTLSKVKQGTDGRGIPEKYIDPLEAILVEYGYKHRHFIRRTTDESWTEAETFCLINFYNKVDFDILMDVLQRTELAIRRRAADLGLQKKLRRLTTKEKNYIIEHQNKSTHQQMANALGLKRNTVTKFLSDMKKPR